MINKISIKFFSSKKVIGWPPLILCGPSGCGKVRPYNLNNFLDNLKRLFNKNISRQISIFCFLHNSSSKRK
jgi:hypothetical protein